MQGNPWLEIPNPYKEIEMQQADSFQHGLEFQRLCWDVFHVNENGKRLYEILREKYLLSATFSPVHPQAQSLALYWEGFKEAIRGFYNLGLQHQKYVNGVTNNESRSASKPASHTTSK